MGKAKGDAFAEVTRTMVENLDGEIKEHKEDANEFKKYVQKIVENMDKKFDKLEDFMRDEFKDVKEKQTDLFNHQSSRVPQEMVKRLNILYSTIAAIVTGSTVAIVSHLI